MRAPERRRSSAILDPAALLDLPEASWGPGLRSTRSCKQRLACHVKRVMTLCVGLGKYQFQKSRIADSMLVNMHLLLAYAYLERQGLRRNVLHSILRLS